MLLYLQGRSSCWVFKLVMINFVFCLTEIRYKQVLVEIFPCSSLYYIHHLPYIHASPSCYPCSKNKQIFSYKMNGIMCTTVNVAVNILVDIQVIIGRQSVESLKNVDTSLNRYVTDTSSTLHCYKYESNKIYRLIAA